MTNQNNKLPYSEIATMSAFEISRVGSNRGWGDLYNEFLLRLEKTQASEALYVSFDDEKLCKCARNAFSSYLKLDDLTPEQVVFRVSPKDGKRILTCRRGPAYKNGK